MEKEYFRKLLKQRNGVEVREDLFVFNDFEVYNALTEESRKYVTFDEMWDAEEEVRTAVDDEKDDFTVTLDGGRGAGSSSGEMGGGFGHAGIEGRGSDKTLYPASFNAVNATTKSYGDTLKIFADKYKNADREYGVAVDDDGFVHKHVEGGAHSVSLVAKKGEMMLHNHPGGGNFSDLDLINTAKEASKGIVAVGSKKTYSFVKTNKFKAKEFIKAVKKAKWPKNLGYNEGADWWLRRNAKEYGYKYTARKTK
jgi:hypothetical protein